MTTNNVHRQLLIRIADEISQICVGNYNFQDRKSKE